MKRGAKIVLLGVGAVVATAAMVFLLINLGLVTYNAGCTHTGKTGVHQTSAAVGQRTTRRSTSTEATATNCGINRSFAPQCVNVEPQAYELHRSAQAVGRTVLGATRCSGVLLGNKTIAYFLTAAKCLPTEGIVGSVQIELENCIGSQVFTQSGLFYINRELGFVVLRLATRGFNVAAHYGFLRLRPSGPAKDEAVFVPHFIDNRAKRITTDNDQGPVRVQRPTVASAGCFTGTEVPMSRVQFEAAQLDNTAVGAPVISRRDYSVVAIHVCGDCQTSGANLALPTTAIIEDLVATGHLVPSFITASE